MKDNARPYTRGPQLLKILAAHGALSVRGLEIIVTPKMTRRRLRESLARLRNKNYIVKMHDAMFGGTGVYYRLNYDSVILKKLSNKIGVTEESLVQPTVRRVELLHSERCAIWTEIFRGLLPSAIVIRDFSFSLNSTIQKLLLTKSTDFEQRPDIMILGKSACGTKQFSVAVEIERTLKSDKRLFHKLRKFARETRLDGVIYLCDDDTVANRLRFIYQSKVLENSIRIKPYGNNFLLIGSSAVSHCGLLQNIYNSAGQNISLAQWFTLISEDKITLRRDSKFQLPASGG